MEKLDFEQGPIRPPSEARSLLIRLTRNCPWNKCLFCGVYKGTQFSRRSVKEIKEDIQTITRIRRGDVGSKTTYFFPFVRLFLI